jgi:hypothetical protein
MLVVNAHYSDDLDRDSLFELLWRFNAAAFGAGSLGLDLERLASGARRWLARRNRIPALLRCAGVEQDCTIQAVFAVGFRIRSQAALDPGSSIEIELRAEREPDYVFPCRVVSISRDREYGLVLIGLPYCALPCERWEEPTRGSRPNARPCAA